MGEQLKTIYQNNRHLGNPIINQQVNMTFGENQYSLISDSNGFVEKLLTLPVSYDLGIYSISWDYNGDLYYLANSQGQRLTVVASTFINVESKAEVLVGESFIFSGSIVDDMESPLNTSLGFYFDGKYVDTLWTDENGSFYNEYTVPVETKAGPNMLTIQYVSNDFYLASSFNWQLQVYHDIRIETGEFEGILNSSASISGVVYDKANRTVDDLEIRMFFDGYSLPVDTITDSQGIFTFTLDMPFGTELGYHQLNFIFA